MAPDLRTEGRPPSEVRCWWRDVWRWLCHCRPSEQFLSSIHVRQVNTLKQPTTKYPRRVLTMQKPRTLWNGFIKPVADRVDVHLQWLLQTCCAVLTYTGWSQNEASTFDCPRLQNAWTNLHDFWHTATLFGTECIVSSVFVEFII